MAQEMNEIVKLAEQLNNSTDLDSKVTEELLSKLKAMSPSDPPKKKKEKAGKISLKNPKGTIDQAPFEMAIREQLFNKIVKVFKKHGAETIDTPVFELKEILTNKYGEDSKLIYDVESGADSHEKLSLRYDLTVPFARYVAQNKIQNIKRYHVAKVYRRDQPYMTKGRYREFYQCDFDIAGANYAPMFPDAECLKICDEILTALDIGQFQIKLNDRRILDGIFAACGCPDDKFRGACAEVDKLDKLEWDEGETTVKCGLLKKGLTEECVDQIGQYVRRSGMNDLVQELLADEKLCANKSAKEGLTDMALLLEYLELWGVGSVRFDLSLARGLDYYTGPIYEAVMVPSSGEETEKKSGTTVGVGSVAAGGRYDNLIGSLSGGKGKSNVPCVGISFGVERLYTLLKNNIKDNDIKVQTTDTVCYIMSGQKGQRKNRAIILNELWDAGIPVETSYKENPKLLTDLQTCESRNIPWGVVFGEKEIESGIVKLRNIATRDEIEVKRSELAETIKKNL